MEVTPDAILEATQSDLFWVPDSVIRLDEPSFLAISDGSDSELFNQVVRTAPDADPRRIVPLIDDWHTGASRWLVVPSAPADLEDVLSTHGYRPTFHADAYTLATDTDLPVGEAQVVQVDSIERLQHNLHSEAVGFGRPARVVDLDRELSLCAKGARTARFVAYVNGQVAGSANINRYDALGFGLLWAGAVLPEFRGRGVYRALLQARVEWARAQRMRTIGLYARRETSAPVVRGVGFEKHGPMAYWCR